MKSDRIKSWPKEERSRDCHLADARGISGQDGFLQTTEGRHLLRQQIRDVLFANHVVV